MRPHELAIVIGDANKAIDDAIQTALHSIESKFVSDNPDLSNEDVDKHYQAHKAMCSYIVFSGLASKTKKSTDESKKDLDACCRAVGASVDGEPDTSRVVLANNVLTFSKRQNKDTITCATNDLLTELSKLGVEKAVLDKAKQAATKSRRGNVYYEVSATEG